MLTLYDAARCPYCARARIVLAEKGVEYETIEIDLSDRPAWIYEKNSTGRVPVLEEDGWLLPESAVIMEYLEERYPEPPLLAADPGDRASPASRSSATPTSPIRTTRSGAATTAQPRVSTPRSAGSMQRSSSGRGSGEPTTGSRISPTFRGCCARAMCSASPSTGSPPLLRGSTGLVERPAVAMEVEIIAAF